MTIVRRHRLWSLALLALAIVAVAAGAWWTATGAPTPALTATVGGGVAAVASWCEAERARSAAWLAQRLRGGRP